MKSEKKPRPAKPQPSGLAGKVALVTGGASGTGRNCLRVLATAGVRVVLADVDAVQGAKLVAELARKCVRARFVRADVTQADQVHALVAEVVRRFGRLDFASNNAGPAPGRRLCHRWP